MIKKYLQALKADFWGTMGHWQDLRPIWLFGGAAALLLEIFSVLYYQNYLGLNPCEMCVYIRFSMLVIFLGAMFAAIKPDSAFFKIVGYTVVIWGLVRGILWDITLEIENLRAQDPDWYSTCSLTSIKYPFGLPLEQWFPSHFMPLTLCGEADNAWSLFGLNMSEWLFFVYGVFSLGIFLMLASWVLRLIKGRRQAGGAR